jgi:glycine cleavage system H lipoate-binding protein
MAATIWGRKNSGSRMACPFLRESEVRYCEGAAVRKPIPLARAARAEEKCSSPEYTACPVYRMQAQAGDAAPYCPHLRESLMQYCAAAPVTRFIPYSESLLSRCGNDSHRYCELYLSMAHPELPSEDVDGIPLPGWLKYTANHLWLDVTGDGVCHAGIDAFFSRALGNVERISYVWLKGPHRPAAVLTVSGIEVEVVFPNSFLLTNCNLYLRADPSRLAAQPYNAAWLFEGIPEEGTLDNLVEGAAARDWMEQEHRRMNEFLQQEATPAGVLAADGGLFAPGLVRRLDRERMLALCHEFFSPYASGRSEASR